MKRVVATSWRYREKEASRRYWEANPPPELLRCGFLSLSAGRCDQPGKRVAGGIRCADHWPAVCS